MHTLQSMHKTSMITKVINGLLLDDAGDKRNKNAGEFYLCVSPLPAMSSGSSSSSKRLRRSRDFMKGNFRLKAIFCPRDRPRLCPPPTPLTPLTALLTERSKLDELRDPWKTRRRFFLPCFRSQRDCNHDQVLNYKYRNIENNNNNGRPFNSAKWCKKCSLQLQRCSTH